MKVQFNEAQLSRPQQQSLIKVLDDLQSKNENELVVTPVEFPLKLKVRLDDDIEILLGWDAEKKSYNTDSFIGKQIPTPDDKFIEDHPIPTALDEPEPTPEPTPEPDIDPKELARLKYDLMSTHLNMPVEKKIIFNKEYARLWSEHK